MLWILSILLAIVVVITKLVLPLSATLGYATVFAWIISLVYLIFYHKDEISKTIDKNYSDRRDNLR